MRQSFEDRFWSHVTRQGDEECWPWKLSVGSRGYGVTSRREAGRTRILSAHRVAYELAHGAIPPAMCVCHKCDSPPCCNPAHLFLGTFAENNADRKRKGRNGTSAFTGFSTEPPRGELNRHAKLTADVVRGLRRDYEAGILNQAAAARLLGVHETSIYKLIHRTTWKHVA